MKIELVKRQDRYDLYGADGAKIASSTENPFGKLSKENCDEIFGYIQQPTEIEVEIRCYIGNGDKESDSFKDPLVTNTGIPKLDADGCLILRKL